MTTLAGARLLIVEDDPDTVELLGEQLAPEGYDLSFALNGEDAILRTGADVAPDLVIMDVMMPRLDGLETTRFFKARYKDRFLPVMILSAKGDRESIAEGIRMGVDDYMTKPYSGSVLKERISRLLELKSAEDALAAAESPSAADDLANLRLSMAEDFTERGLFGLAREYLSRNTEIVPDHAGSIDLLSRIAGRD
jgi:DNA-binding response OmpR family regulator